MLGLLALVCGASASAREAPITVGEHRLIVGTVSLWYRVAGRAGGTPVLFLHGGPGEGSQTFAATAGPLLERGQRIIYFDARGAGRSDRPHEAANYSIDLMVGDIEQLRRHLGVRRLSLIGHSFGTILALEYAAHYPDHVEKVVLAAAVPDLIQQTDLMCARLATTDAAAYARASAGIEGGATPRCNVFAAYPGAMQAYVYRNMFPDPATAARVDALDAAGGLANSGESSRALFGSGLLRYRFTQAGRVTAPVLIVAGGADYQAVIEPQRALAAALPHGRLIEYPSNGHFMFVEDPERFARDVSAFLRGGRGRESPLPDALLSAIAPP